MIKNMKNKIPLEYMIFFLQTKKKTHKNEVVTKKELNTLVNTGRTSKWKSEKVSCQCRARDESWHFSVATNTLSVKITGLKSLALCQHLPLYFSFRIFISKVRSLDEIISMISSCLMFLGCSQYHNILLCKFSRSRNRAGLCGVTHRHMAWFSSNKEEL